MKKMAHLKNIDHTFDVALGDVGCTIRKGRKWSDAPVGEELILMNCHQGHSGECGDECKCEGHGRVIGSWVGQLKDLPPNLLKIEHNNKAKDLTELMKMMYVGYGTISETDIITALLYERTATK
jgi:hypothetical protein